MHSSVWQWSAGDLAEAIRRQKLSSVEVVTAHLDRIQEVNPKVNAITAVLEEEALTSAKEADRQISGGKEIGLLHGVPITIKENVDVVGSATTYGIVAYKDAMPEADAPIVSHLKRAGAIPIGRTNLPDFGLCWHTANDLRGETVNPWNSALTPGGSSGGEAAAIATGMSPLGLGNDMGGSLRYPAQCCGIAAIRPTLGRVSRVTSSTESYDPMFYEQIASVNGPMARHVRDLRLALEVISQPDTTDPWWMPVPQLQVTRSQSIRVALTLNPGGLPCDAAVADGIRKAADILADSGYIVAEADPPALDVSTQVIEDISNMELASYLPNMIPLISQSAQRFLECLTNHTKPDLLTYMQAIAKRHRIAQEWSIFMEEYPLILGPVSTRPPFKINHDLAGPEQLAEFVQSIKLTEICNLLGLPSLTVPVLLVDGVPQGIQLISRRYREDLCLDAAEMIEQQQGVFTPIEPRNCT